MYMMYVLMYVQYACVYVCTYVCMYSTCVLLYVQYLSLSISFLKVFPRLRQGRT